MDCATTTLLWSSNNQVMGRRSPCASYSDRIEGRNSYCLSIEPEHLPLLQCEQEHCHTEGELSKAVPRLP